jgi:PAS domain S-box-containing protein
MAETSNPINLVLNNLPVPAFVARYDGTLVHANPALAAIAGQPNLVRLDRSLFSLGVFSNAAEYQGFIASFRHGGKTRRLVLPVGRLRSSQQSLILFATLIDFGGQAAVCGVISQAKVPNELIMGRGAHDDTSLLDRIECYACRISNSGEILSMNSSLLIELGTNRADDRVVNWTDFDVEQDRKSLLALMKLARTRGSASFETILQRADGSLFPVAGAVKPLPGVRYKNQFMISAHDLSERRGEQQKLRKLELEVENLRVQLARRSVLISEKFSTQDSFSIVSESSAYERILKQIKLVAPTDSTVLVTGETGTGKELIARAIHARSLRAARPLLILNCGALPAELIESELFGYRKGAFTGARADHLGRFELADEGTLFLDEIGEMPMLLQTRLLRVLQDGEFTPLGAKESIHTDVRIIAATNRNLRDRVAEGAFRADLYFRLNVFPIHSPPLRERPEDIPLLANHFIAKYTPRGQPRRKLHPKDEARLLRYDFEGNVRELENLIQRALIVSEGEFLRIHLEGTSSPAPNEEAGPAVRGENAEVLNFTEAQRRHIIRVLKMTDGKVSGKGGAAELLGLNAQTLFSKMRKLNISRKKEQYS